VISDLASEWKEHVENWFAMNAGYKEVVNGKEVPTRNEEYLIYQTLAGIWPFEGQADETLKERLREFFIKAMREAKTHTTWNDPEEDHENALIGFLFRLLEPESDFSHSFIGFMSRICRFGILNSLVQVILKISCPGIPDIYQGSEMWDFSLVDPDNRRPVDFDFRWNRLSAIIRQQHDEAMFREMTGNLQAGDVKLWFIHVLLQERKADPELFSYGEYIPAQISGSARENFMAFFRRHGSRWLLVVVPLHLASLKRDWDLLISEGMAWAEAEVLLPEWCSGPCLEVLFRQKISLSGKLLLSESFSYLPMIVLRSLP
jgi:maltooligosyltrehalose synthase